MARRNHLPVFLARARDDRCAAIEEGGVVRGSAAYRIAEDYENCDEDAGGSETSLSSAA